MFISLPFVLALIFMLVKQIVLYIESQSGWDLCTCVLTPIFVWIVLDPG